MNLPLSLVKQTVYAKGNPTELRLLAQRKDLDEETATEIFIKNDREANRILAKRGLLTTIQLDKLANSPDPKDARLVLGAPNISREQFQKFLYSSRGEERQACLASPLLTLGDLRGLMRDRKQSVRAAAYRAYCRVDKQLVSLEDWRRGLQRQFRTPEILSMDVPFEVFDEDTLRKMSEFEKRRLLENKFWQAKGFSKKIRELYPRLFPFGSHSLVLLSLGELSEAAEGSHEVAWRQDVLREKSYLRRHNALKKILNDSRLDEETSIEILRDLIHGDYISEWNKGDWGLFQKKIVTEIGLKKVLEMAPHYSDSFAAILLKFKGWTTEMLEVFFENGNPDTLVALIENSAATKEQIARAISKNPLKLERATTRRVLEKNFSLYELLNLPIAPEELLRIESVAKFVKENVQEGKSSEAFLANLIATQDLTLGNVLSLTKLSSG